MTLIYSYLINTLYCSILKAYCHRKLLAFAEYTVLFRLLLFLYLEPGIGPAIYSVPLAWDKCICMESMEGNHMFSKDAQSVLSGFVF